MYGPEREESVAVYICEGERESTGSLHRRSHRRHCSRLLAQCRVLGARGHTGTIVGVARGFAAKELSDTWVSSRRRGDRGRCMEAEQYEGKEEGTHRRTQALYDIL